MTSLLVVGGSRKSTVERRVVVVVLRLPRGAEVGVVCWGHVTAGARTRDAHLDLIVPLQTEQTAHHDRHVAAVWISDAGHVQLTVGGRRMTTVARLILSTRRRG